MTIFQCPNCPAHMGTELNITAENIGHACPKTFDKTRRRFGKVVTFEALPPVEAPEYSDGVVEVLGRQVWVDEAGYAYDSNRDGSLVNVHNNWAQMLATF